MRSHQVLPLPLLLVIASVASENASTSRGCGLDLLPQYVSLCDLDAIWGIVVEAVAGAGALITLLLMLILLENPPNYFDTSQPRMRETAFEEDVHLPRAYMENKAFSMDEHNAALRSAAGFSNGSLGKRSCGSLGKKPSSLGSRPSAPFRSNVYQPTEMAVVLNGGTIPTAPPSHTGRHHW